MARRGLQRQGLDAQAKISSAIDDVKSFFLAIKAMSYLESSSTAIAVSGEIGCCSTISKMPCISELIRWLLAANILTCVLTVFGIASLDFFTGRCAISSRYVIAVVYVSLLQKSGRNSFCIAFSFVEPGVHEDRDAKKELLMPSFLHCDLKTTLVLNYLHRLETVGFDPN